MRTYINLFFFGLLFLAACKGNGIPDDVIPKKKMTSLLTEVHLIDGTMYTVVQNPDSLYKYGMGKYVNLFKRYGTDTTQFNRSMYYYTTHIDILELIYDDVLINMKAKTDSLNRLKSKVDAAKADSIQKLKTNLKKPEVDSINKIRNTQKK